MIWLQTSKAYELNFCKLFVEVKGILKLLFHTRTQIRKFGVGLQEQPLPEQLEAASMKERYTLYMTEQKIRKFKIKGMNQYASNLSC